MKTSVVHTHLLLIMQCIINGFCSHNCVRDIKNACGNLHREPRDNIIHYFGGGWEGGYIISMHTLRLYHFQYLFSRRTISYMPTKIISTPRDMKNLFFHSSCNRSATNMKLNLQTVTNKLRNRFVHKLSFSQFFF